MDNNILSCKDLYRRTDTNDHRVNANDHHANNAQDDITYWSGHSDEKVISDRATEVCRICVDWFSPTEPYQKNHNKSNRIYMCEWVRRQSSLQARSGISELIRASRVGIFMQSN